MRIFDNFSQSFFKKQRTLNRMNKVVIYFSLRNDFKLYSLRIDFIYPYKTCVPSSHLYYFYIILFNIFIPFNTIILLLYYLIKHPVKI